MAARTDLIHCDLCGEDYSATYRKCPFCNGRGDLLWEEDDYDRAQEEYHSEERPRTAPRGGARRAGGNTRGGGYGKPRRVLRLLFFFLSLALIVAAFWILISVALPFLFPKGNDPAVGSSAPPSGSSPVVSSPVVSSPVVSQPSESTPAESTPSESTPATGTPSESTPAGSRPAASSLRLNRSDFTLDRSSPTFRITATGAAGAVTWSSSKPEVATVSGSGLVTAVGPGNTTVTAVDESGAKATCIVRVPSSFTASGDASPSVSPSASQSADNSSASLSHSDVTLSNTLGLSFTLKLRGTTDTATWSSSNTSVATVSASGLVTGVSSGTATITATLSDGTTLKCVVRVSR